MADNDDDFDDEELLLVTGRGTKAGAKKRSRKADDSEDEDERPTRQQKSAAKRRQAAAADSEDEDSDGMDAEERAKLEQMNELEREMYLFEREEILQRQRERKQVLNQARKEAEQVKITATAAQRCCLLGCVCLQDLTGAALGSQKDEQRQQPSTQIQLGSWQLAVLLVAGAISCGWHWLITSRMCNGPECYAA